MTPSEVEIYVASKECSSDAAWLCFLGVGTLFFAGIVANFLA